MDGQQPPQGQPGQPGDETDERGLKSFLANVVHNVTTKKPESNAQIDADVAGLHAAFKGIGTKNDQLIAILCNKSKEDLQRLRAVYDHGQPMDLLSKIQLETSGRFQAVFEAMLCTDAELRAHYVHRAVKGIGTDEMMLIDVILTASNQQVRDMKAAYQKHFLIPLQLRVDLDTSGKFQGVLDAILNLKRPESGVQRELVETDIETLYNATAGKAGTDEKAILNLIATRSRDHLEFLNTKYKDRSPKHRTFAEEIKMEVSGIFWVQKAFVASFLGPAAWHAWRLHMEMRGLGTDENGLMRSILVPTQSELKAATRILQTVYKEDLQARVKSELWGNAKHALATYVGFVVANVRDPGDVAQAGPNPGGEPFSVPAEAQQRVQQSPDTKDKKDKKDKKEDKDGDDKKKDKKDKKGKDSGDEGDKRDKKDKKDKKEDKDDKKKKK